MRAQELTHDKKDITRIAKKIMNEITKQRMISKQEAMVLLGELDLFICSEIIANVSISSSKRLRRGNEAKTDATKFRNKMRKESQKIRKHEYGRLLQFTGKQ